MGGSDMNLKRRQPWLGQIRHIHMVGIGGIGMSSIAAVLLARGFQVTGSDLCLSEVTDQLINQGAVIYDGHQEAHVRGADVVVYSSAVKATENVETQMAITQRIPLISRSEMLGELMRMKYGIGVSGTHGKTTVTSMVGSVAAQAGFDPTVIVGGKVTEFNGNALHGEGDIIVIEADEYDRAFLRLSPALAVITAIEADHLDVYRDLGEIYEAFIQFAMAVPFFGAVIVCLDDPGVQAIMEHIDRRLVTYGVMRQAMVRAEQIRQKDHSLEFDVRVSGEILGTIRLGALGLHNVRNALAACAVGLELEIDFEHIISGLERFTGVRRRFQVLAEVNGILIVDDYAHHPTEVVTTLAAASEGYPDRRIVAIFQPHSYSRTNDFKDEFATSFFNADLLIVTDIYQVREVPIPQMTGQVIANLAGSKGHQDARFIQHKEDLLPTLIEICRSGDLVLFMGAGDIWRTARQYTEQLSQSVAA